MLAVFSSSLHQLVGGGITTPRRRKRECRRGVAECRATGKREDALEFRLWGRSGLPRAVEAILLEEALHSPGEILAAEDDTLAEASTSNLSDNLLNVLFTSAAFGLALLTAGVIYVAVTDFIDNRKNQELNKEAEKKAKKAPKKKKTEEAAVNGRASPRGFGQSGRVTKQSTD